MDSPDSNAMGAACLLRLGPFVNEELPCPFDKLVVPEAVRD